MVKKILVIGIRLLIFVAIISACVYGVLFVKEQKAKVHVEEYCAVVNAHDVAAYKECKQLNAIKILDNLKDKNGELMEVPFLEAIK